MKTEMEKNAKSSGQHLRLVQAMADFQVALSALDFMSECPEVGSRVEIRRYRCFQDAAVIAYWRPFTQTKGLPVLSFKQLGIKPNSAQLALHNRIGDYRNKVVAHSDESGLRIAYQTAEVLDGIMLPHLQFYEGLEFFDDRRLWTEWLHSMTHAGGVKLFVAAQGRAPQTIVRDDRIS